MTHLNSQKGRNAIIRPSELAFFGLLGEELGIACQLHLNFIDNPNGDEPSVRIFREYRKKELAFLDPQKQRAQIFEHPEIIAAGHSVFTFAPDWRATALFSGKNREFAKYVKLVFKRRKNAETKLPHTWMSCARANENVAFGFSLEEERDIYHVYLAYPGISGSFEPLYVKIQKPEQNGFAYYRITAEDAGAHDDILIQLRGVDEEGVPHTLFVSAPCG